VFVAQCHSKEESTRTQAIAGCQTLARQCSDGSAIEALIKLFFSVLNSTYHVHKIGVNDVPFVSSDGGGS
jgi:hypothetical protein